MDLASFDIVDLLPFAGALLGAGAIAGLLAGLLGVGGGIVVVPVLYILFPFMGVPDEIRMHLAVGTSLATIIPTSIMSAKTHYKKGGLDPELLFALTPGIIGGVIIGTILGGKADGVVLTLIFATIALAVAANMAFNRPPKVFGETLPTGPKRQVMGLVIGGISVVMGIGGGTLSVPLLTAYSVPIRRAVGTAAAIGLVIALPGTIGFMMAGWGHPDLPAFSVGFVNLLGLALIVPTTILTAPWGAKIAHAIPPEYLQWAFAFFLCVTSARMFYGVWSG